MCHSYLAPFSYFSEWYFYSEPGILGSNTAAFPGNIYFHLFTKRQLHIFIGIYLVHDIFRNWHTSLLRCQKSTIFYRNGNNSPKCKNCVKKIHFNFSEEMIICADCKKSFCTWALRNPSLSAPLRWQTQSIVRGL